MWMDTPKDTIAILQKETNFTNWNLFPQTIWNFSNEATLEGENWSIPLRVAPPTFNTPTPNAPPSHNTPVKREANISI